MGLIQKESLWQELIDAGKFEKEKALLSAEAIKKEVIASDSHKSIPEVFQNPTASLATIRKYQGEDKMLAVLASLISGVADQLNIGRSLSEIQLVHAAKLIVSEYWYLTIADFKVCFRSALLGKYGKVFDRLDAMILLEWIREYMNERAHYAEVFNHNKQHEKHIPSQTAVPPPDELLKALRELEEKYKGGNVGATKNEADPQAKATVRYRNFSEYLECHFMNTKEVKRALLAYWLKSYNGLADEAKMKEYLKAESHKCLILANKNEELPKDLMKVIKKALTPKHKEENLL